MDLRKIHKVSDTLRLKYFSFVYFPSLSSLLEQQLLDIPDFPKIMKGYMKSKGKKWIIVHFLGQLAFKTFILLEW